LNCGFDTLESLLILTAVYSFDVTNCGNQIQPPTTFDFSFRNVWHAPPLPALRRVEAAEGGCGGRRFGLQSLSAAMQAEQQTVLVVNRVVHERFFFTGNTVGCSEFFFSGPIGLPRSFGLVQQTKQRKNASK